MPRALRDTGGLRPAENMLEGQWEKIFFPRIVHPDIREDLRP